MNKNIIIVTLLLLLFGSTALWYTINRKSHKQNVELTEMIDESLVHINRLVISEKNAIDSANHYRTLADKADQKVDSLLDKTVEYEQEIDDITNIIAEITPNQAYDSLQKYIPVATGELEYGFDSTQVKDLYADELKLEKLEPMVVTLGETIEAQGIQIVNLEKESEQVRAAVDSCNLRADKAMDLADTAMEQTEVVENELKWWKRGSVVVVLTVIAIALL